MPRDNQMRGYAGHIRQTLSVLARVENRSELAVLRDISVSSYDTQLIRNHPETPPGTIPLNDAEKATEGLRQWVLSGAVAETLHAVALVQPARKPAEAVSFMNTVLLGPSYEGSYIMSVQIPVVPVYAQEHLQFEEPIYQPLARRIANKLYTATERALATAEDVVYGRAGLSDFANHGEYGVSANLCEALSRMSGETQKRYEIDFGWALGRPSEPTAPLRFAEPTLEALKEAARELRAISPEEDVFLSGTVVRLHRENLLRPGEVTIVGIVGSDDNQLRRVWVELDTADYERATFAHNEGRVVTLRGDLERTPNRYWLRRPNGFQVLAE